MVIGLQLLISLRQFSLLDFGIKTVWYFLSMSGIVTDTIQSLKISIIQEYLGSVLERSPNVIPSGLGAEFLVIPLMLLAISFSVMRAWKVLLSTLWAGVSTTGTFAPSRALPGREGGFCTPHVPCPTTGQGLGLGHFPLCLLLLRESLLDPFPPLTDWGAALLGSPVLLPGHPGPAQGSLLHPLGEIKRLELGKGEMGIFGEIPQHHAAAEEAGKVSGLCVEAPCQLHGPILSYPCPASH